MSLITIPESAIVDLISGDLSRSHFMILCKLARLSDSQLRGNTRQRIADLAGISQSGLYHSIGDLEEEGWVVRLDSGGLSLPWRRESPEPVPEPDMDGLRAELARLSERIDAVVERLVVVEERQDEPPAPRVIEVAREVEVESQPAPTPSPSRETADAGAEDGSTEGHRLLQSAYLKMRAAGALASDFYARIEGVGDRTVRGWLSGAVPRIDGRLALREALGIPLEAWDD